MLRGDAVPVVRLHLRQRHDVVGLDDTLRKPEAGQLAAAAAVGLPGDGFVVEIGELDAGICTASFTPDSTSAISVSRTCPGASPTIDRRAPPAKHLRRGHDDGRMRRHVRNLARGLDHVRLQEHALADELLRLQARRQEPIADCRRQRSVVLLIPRNEHTGTRSPQLHQPWRSRQRR